MTTKPQTIDGDQVIALQAAVNNLGQQLAALNVELEYRRIKIEAMQAARESFVTALTDKGVDLETLFSDEGDAEVIKLDTEVDKALGNVEIDS